MPIAHSDWPRLLTLVDQALDLPAPDRPGWLRDLELPTPLKDALEGLLAQRRSIETGNFLGGLPMLPPETRGSLVAGGRAGPWRLLHEIGQGGMSSVWLAERADDQITRRVALKLPHAGPGQDVLAARLLREREILASLEHPHIARLYDVGLTDAGTPFLVMEYVEGESLLAHADAQHLTIGQRLALFLQVLQAVHFAHGKLILHRDIKPGNILVTHSGEVKLLDFGVAKLLAPNGASLAVTELTHLAGRPLTPAYASPEQLQGEALGTASDVFSLGLVLYELLCGYRPFTGPGMSAAQAEHATLHLDPKPLHKQQPTAEIARARGTTVSRLGNVLAGDLNAVVHKALAKAPEDRYASVDALTVDVTRWLDGKPLLAQAPGFWYYFGKLVRRNKLGVGLGAAALCALVGTSAAALMQSHVATQEAARAESVRAFLVAMFKETDLDRAGSKELTAKALLSSGRQRVAGTLAQDPALRAELLASIGKAQMNVSDRTGAEDTLAESARLYHDLKSGERELQVQLDRADNAMGMGRNDAAKAFLDQASAIAEARDPDARVAASLAQMQGTIAMFRGEDALAKSAFERYLTLAENDPQTPPAQLVGVLLPLAWVTSNNGTDLPGAMALIARARQVAQAHPDLSAADRMDVVKYGQSIALDWGRYAQVQQSSADDIRDCDRALSSESNTCLRLRANLQVALVSMGRLTEAVAINDQLAFMLDPASPRDRWQASVALARTLAWTGQLEQRHDLIEQVRQFAQPRTGEELDAPYRLIAIDALAEMSVLMGRPAEALAWAAEADKVAASDGQTSARPFGSRKSRVFEGVALRMLGQHAAALSKLAHFCSASGRPPGMARVQDHLFSLNCVPSLAASGQQAAATKLLQDALPVLRDSLGADAPSLRRAEHWLEELRTTGRLTPPRTPAEALFS